MHFATLLASVAALVGQTTAARCGPAPAGMDVLSPCLDGSTKNWWKCDSAGAIVSIVMGNTYKLTAASRTVAVKGSCVKNPEIAVTMQCPPDTTGRFDLVCPNMGTVQFELLV
ncbi:hypothetical protein E4U53_000949 [Claviceps sorghi]|nr:hypothetical protein E4U53_000949 [Claviceps sorghi]